MTFNGPLMLLFRHHVPRCLVFQGIVVCKKSFGLHTWQQNPPPKGKELLALYCAARAGCSEDAAGSLQGRAPDSHLVWPSVSGQPLDCLLLFLGAAPIFRRSRFPARWTAELRRPCCYNHAESTGDRSSVVHPQ